MRAFVLDCSVTMTWCFEDELDQSAEQTIVLLKNMPAIVPAIWPLEVMNVLRVAERKKRIDASSIDDFIHLLNTLPIELDTGISHLLDGKILTLMRNHHLSAYDAAYLEVALRYEIPLISLDIDLCKAAKKEGVALLLEPLLNL